MFASYKPGTIALRSLTADDVAGLCAIYPSTTTRVVSPTPVQQSVISATPCDPTPRHGLTTKCVTPIVREEGCAVRPGARGGAGAVLLVGTLAIAGSLRRRRRSR
jgi:hypothetical protein